MKMVDLGNSTYPGFCVAGQGQGSQNAPSLTRENDAPQGPSEDL